MRRTRINKFFLNTVGITFFMLLYVHQNIEIIKMGYRIDDNQKRFSSFLEQQKRLTYDLAKLKSPLELDRRLDAKEIDLTEANINSIYYASAKFMNAMPNAAGSNNPRLIDKILDAFTEKAEARTAKVQKNK